MIENTVYTGTIEELKTALDTLNKRGYCTNTDWNTWVLSRSKPLLHQNLILSLNKNKRVKTIPGA